MLGILLDAQARVDVRAESLHIPHYQRSLAIEKNYWISLDSHIWQVDALIMTLQKPPIHCRLQLIVSMNNVPRCYGKKGQMSRLESPLVSFVFHLYRPTKQTFGRRCDNGGTFKVRRGAKKIMGVTDGWRGRFNWGCRIAGILGLSLPVPLLFYFEFHRFSIFLPSFF